jgi:hypothetical protein
MYNKVTAALITKYGQEQMIKLKRGIYSMLLKIPVSELTEMELDLMYELSKDQDIQNILEKHI